MKDYRRSIIARDPELGAALRAALDPKDDQESVRRSRHGAV